MTIAVGTGAAAAWQPTDVAGLQLWLTADSDVYTDTGATSPAGDGNLVAHWGDQSGLNHDALQSTSTERPTYRASVASLNGEPALEFSDAGKDFLVVGDDLVHDSDAHTTVVVINWLALPLDNGDRIFGQTGGPGKYWGLLCSSDGRPVFQFHTSTAGDTRSVAAPNSMSDALGPHIYLMRATSGDTTLWANGVLIGSVTNAWAGTIQAPHSKGVGAYTSNGNDSSGYAFDGQIAEVICYDTYLSDSDLRELNTYLGNKYGMSQMTGREFDPGDLADLTLWLRADQHVYTGVTYPYVPADGDDVRYWGCVAKGFFAEQGTDSLPTWDDAVSAMNDQPALAFDEESEDALVTSDPLVHGATAQTTFLVINLIGETLDGFDRVMGQTGASDRLWGLAFGDDGRPYFNMGVTNAAGTIYASGSSLPESRNGASGTYVYASRNTSGEYTIWENGLAATSGVSDAWSGISAPDLKKIGGYANTTDRFFDGDIAEVILFTRYLSDEEIVAVHDYLGRRYDLPQMMYPRGSQFMIY